MRAPLWTVLFPLSLCLGSAAAQPGGESTFAIPDRIPIHTAPADPDGGAYGTWAAGPGYKASFHDGFAFHPVLGPAATRGLPFRWRTAAIRIGGRQLAVGGDGRAVGPYRFEFDHGEIVEAYDVRTDGVEQTFVLGTRPESDGDLVIRGAVETALRADDAPAAVRAVAWRDHTGRAVIDYGAALAYDARGQTTPVTTVVRGGVIELRVPGAWLAAATPPVVVDPLVGLATMAGAGGAFELETVEAVRDDQSDRTLVVVTRASLGGDSDCIALAYDASGARLGIVYSDITSAWNSRNPQAAYCSASADWLIAVQRDFPRTAGIRVYAHDVGDPGINTGTLLSVPRPATTEVDTMPTLGGSHAASANRWAILAWQREVDDSRPAESQSEVWWLRIDGVARTLGPAAPLWPRTDSDQERPNLTAESDGVGSWVAVWQEYDWTETGGPWNVVAVRIDASGQREERAVLGEPADPDNHCLAPVVAGRGGRYLVAYTTDPNEGHSAPTHGDRVAVQRFDWDEQPRSVATKQASRTLRTGPRGTLSTATRGRSVAFDHETDSHWAVGYASGPIVRVDRVGFTGGGVETGGFVQARTGPAVGGSSVLFDDDRDEFAVYYGDDDLGTVPGAWVARRQALRYQAAEANVFGLGCGGSITTFNGGAQPLPYAGSERFAIGLTGATPNAPALLVVGLQQQAIGFGRTCSFYLAGPTFAFAIGQTSFVGSLAVPVPLPDAPVATGTLYWQWFLLASGQLEASNGLETVIE